VISALLTRASSLKQLQAVKHAKPRLCHTKSAKNVATIKEPRFYVPKQIVCMHVAKLEKLKQVNYVIVKVPKLLLQARIRNS
jgi:hypothetical protein